MITDLFVKSDSGMNMSSNSFFGHDTVAGSFQLFELENIFTTFLMLLSICSMTCPKTHLLPSHMKRAPFL